MPLFGITLDEWLEAFSTGGISLIMGTKGHVHDHEHCKHEEVAYCGHCQVVYCKGCKREWSDCKRNHGYYWYPYTYPQWTYTTPVITSGTWTGNNVLTFSGSDDYTDHANLADGNTDYTHSQCTHA